MTDTTITCPHCTSTWTVEAGPDGRGYMRKDLVVIAPALAAHMRDEHGDEDMAIRYERYAITKPGWGNEV